MKYGIFKQIICFIFYKPFSVCFSIRLLLDALSKEIAPRIILLLSFYLADLLGEYQGLANHSQFHHNRRLLGHHDRPLYLHWYQDILSILAYQKDLTLRRKHPCQNIPLKFNKTNFTSIFIERKLSIAVDKILKVIYELLLYVRFIFK